VPADDLNEALAGLQQGTDVAPSRQTVRDFFETRIDAVKPELALTAWTNYGEVAERYVLPYLGAKRLAELAPMDIKRWHGELLDHGRHDGKPFPRLAGRRPAPRIVGACTARRDATR